MEWFQDISQYTKFLTAGLGTILAILGLYMDKEKAYFKIVAPFFIMLVIALGIFQALEANSSELEAENANRQRKYVLTLSNTIAINSAKTSAYLTDILLSQPKILKDFGMTQLRTGKALDQITTADLVTGEILAANKYRMELLVSKPPSERLNTRIWYYNKEMDNPNLVSALEEIGFKVENKIAQRHQAKDPTNAVWYGPEVSLDDYKAVIVSLIRAGINIRRVGPSCKQLDSKKGVIEIGASDLAEGKINGIRKPEKSIEQIRAAQTFEQLSDFKCN